jgi:RNA polymerase sigma factor (sigma-70 family)
MLDAAVEARIDQALVARAVHGDDRRAFEQLLRRHQGMVRAQLRRLTRSDEAAADDLAQEAFLIAWKRLDQFRGDAKFSTWLYRIAYTCFLQSYRKNAKTSDAKDDAEAELMPAPASTVDLQMDIERAMRQLSPAEQNVLLHCVQLGLSHDEAAYVLAMPLGTVKTHATRGKAKLQSLLSAWREVANLGR